MTDILKIYTIRWIWWPGGKERGQFAGLTLHTSPVLAQACFMGQDKGSASVVRPETRNDTTVMVGVLTTASTFLRHQFQHNNGFLSIQAHEFLKIYDKAPKKSLAEKRAVRTTREITDIYKRCGGAKNIPVIHLPRNRVIQEQPVTARAETPADRPQTHSGHHRGRGLAP